MLRARLAERSEHILDIIGPDAPAFRNEAFAPPAKASAEVNR
jgi:hypothetical protein